jgi:outer membrane receptor protein involved in Fe transport
MCQRDPTGVLGCLAATRRFEKTNVNSNFTGTLGSQEFLNIFVGAPAAGFGLNSIYGPDAFANYQEPNDARIVGTPFTPEYFADELQFQAHLAQNFGRMNFSLTGLYQETEVDSRQDYNLGVSSRANLQPALNQLAIFANPALVGPGVAAYFAPLAAAIIPNGPNGPLCSSDTRDDNLGSFEGFSICGDTPGAFDRSHGKGKSWSVEGILSSDFDGPFNFLVGAIYANSKARDVDYYVNSFAIDYVAGLLGSFIGLGSVLDADPTNDLPPGYFATSFYRNNTPEFELKSYGIFGEVYFDISDRLKFTGGLRYNNDKKYVKARNTLASFLNPYSNDGDPFSSPYFPNVTLGAPYDADPGTPGLQAFQERNVGFDKVTGRAVLDFQVTPNNLLYASYSRGYKSGGINPPLAPIFAVPDSFGPEKIDAFEIGSKNTFLNGNLQVNLTGFYYKYSGLQLSRIIARTSVNDSIDANIWGVELESIIRPSDNWLINMGLSYLNAEVAGDQFFSNPRDPGGGDPNSVIIKDITNGALCAVTGPSQAAAAGYVAFINQNFLGLRAPTPFPGNSGIASTGAFSICDTLEDNAPAGIDVLSPGVLVNLKGNKLPQAPNYKASLGVQYTAHFDNMMTLVPRFDISMTGTQYGNVFNGGVNRIAPFTQANAQIQLNGPDDKWFVRAFVQNIFDANSITGLYVTDASSGNYTNIFTLDPRRYGVAVGVSFYPVQRLQGGGRAGPQGPALLLCAALRPSGRKARSRYPRRIPRHLRAA